MKKSKFVGQTYQNWTVTKIYLAANYSHGTKHKIGRAHVWTPVTP